MELSEPERAAARFQAVVSSLLAPGRGAQLFVFGPAEVRLQVGNQSGVPVLAQVLLAQGESAAGLQTRLQPLLTELTTSRAGGEDQRFYLRIIVVTAPAEAQWVDAALRAVCQKAPAAPALQAFQLSSDGSVRSSSSLLFSEVGSALREQAKRPLTLLPETEFAKLGEKAIGQTRANLAEVRDLSQVMQQRRTPVTYAILGLNALLLALSYLWGDPNKTATLGRLGATDAPHILAGEWWRLLAATALHGGVLHLAFNSVGLWNLGRLLEQLLGSARFLTLYVVSGLCGSLVGTALGLVFPTGPSVGASGAICGLLAACGALGLRPRGELPEPVAQNLKNMALWNLGVTAVISLQPHVDWRAHLGGALAGAALTFFGLVRPTVRQEEQANPTRQRWHLGFAVLWAALLLLSIGTAIAKGQPWLLSHPERRHRIAIAGTPLSIEVPRALGHGESGTSGEGTRSWVFRDFMASPLALVVTAIPFSAAEERTQFLQTHWSADLEAAHESKPPFATSERTVGGFPTLAFARTLPSGSQDQGLLQARSHHKVLLQLHVPAGVAPGMVPNLEELLATLQDEPR